MGKCLERNPFGFLTEKLQNTTYFHFTNAPLLQVGTVGTTDPPAFNPLKNGTSHLEWFQRQRLQQLTERDKSGRAQAP